MRVVIAGAGEVGFYLARMMSKESQDIYIIDNDEEQLRYVLDHVDVYGVKGRANEMKVLNEAKVGSADLFIAATSAEETNLLVGILAKKLGAKKVIARVNDFKEIGKGTIKFYESLGIDNVISPVASATREIERMLVNPYFTEAYEFEDGKLIVFGIVVEEKSLLIGKSVAETSHLNPRRSFKPFAILSKGFSGMITKGTVIKSGDMLYFISTPESLAEIFSICGKSDFSVKNLMILGGGRIGMLTAERVQKRINVTLVEKDKDKAHELAGKLKETLVLNVDGRNSEALKEENLENMDVFLAVSDDSEINIISSFFAKSVGVKKTIAKVSNIEHMNLSHNMGIDTLINKKLIAANEIMTYIMEDSVKAMANLLEMDSELIEFTARSTHKIVKDKIKDIALPNQSNIIGVVRNDKGIIPFGDFKVETGDKIICYVSNSCKLELVKFFS